MLATANAVSLPDLELDIQLRQLTTTTQGIIKKRSGKQDSDT